MYFNQYIFDKNIFKYKICFAFGATYISAKSCKDDLNVAFWSDVKLLSNFNLKMADKDAGKYAFIFNF